MRFLLNIAKKSANALPLLAVGFVILAVVGWELFQTSDVAPPTQKHVGELDVSTWNFSRDGSVTLGGDWNYVDSQWAQQISDTTAPVSTLVPGPWPVNEPGRSIARQDGFGTYVLKLRLPFAPVGERFAISTGYWLSSYRVFANGALIASSGTPASNRSSEGANAIKFTPGGGPITLSVFARNDGGVTVQVQDSGIGMTKEEIPKALTAFTQVDDNLSRRAEGTGLGLAIVKSLIEHHDGLLTIESEKGVGTTMRLEFPHVRSIVQRSPQAIVG